MAGLAALVDILDRGQQPSPPPHKGQILKWSVFIMPTENKNSPSVNRRNVLVKLLIILLLTK